MLYWRSEMRKFMFAMLKRGQEARAQLSILNHVKEQRAYLDLRAQIIVWAEKNLLAIAPMVTDLWLGRLYTDTINHISHQKAGLGDV
jgi:hypothetical protein